MKNKIPAFFSILLVAAVLVYCNPVYADIPPDAVEVTTPSYTPAPGSFDPMFGEYRYNVSWQGIPAGNLTLEVRQSGGDYRIRASARTNRFVDLFYKLRFDTAALVETKTLHPKSSVYKRRDDRREKTKIEFLPDGQIKSLHVNKHRGYTEKYLFNPNNFTLDPFSAVFLALSLDWKVGDTRQFDTFTGKSRYLVELTAVEKTSIEAGGSGREVIVISPEVTKLNEEDTSAGKDDKLHDVRIYVSTDPSREILRIESDVFIGTVNTRLVSFTSPDGKVSRSYVPEKSTEPDSWFGPQQPAMNMEYPR
ncbi:MAG: DUF3108 domain-containing protein [Desulfobacteraceae bacterium]|nr:DUF3108 domain-containing protein [Desulfobacteraceae bacterium]